MIYDCRQNDFNWMVEINKPYIKIALNCIGTVEENTHDRKLCVYRME